MSESGSYYVPHGSKWPIIATIGVCTAMSNWIVVKWQCWQIYISYWFNFSSLYDGWLV